MEVLRLIVGIAGLGMFLLGGLVLSWGEIARRSQRSGIGCLGTIFALVAVFGGLGLMGAGGFLIDGSSAPAPSTSGGVPRDAGSSSNVAWGPVDAGTVVDAGRDAAVRPHGH